ncbi:MAG TPA: GNAT family N-acetyltransferase [Candidatus Eisenbacteria bacterium]|nr:GNAT family N-acetyltransferase [Candidatus Eisenbacteria bacterium]
MGNALNRELGVDVESFTTERILEDGFGAAPKFSLLVAEMGGVPAGYALYHASYDSDIAAPSLWLVDLYVEERARRAGAGRALMRALAREALRSGARTVAWCVQDRNERAIAFYRALGAPGLPVHVMELRDEKLSALADGTSP